MPTVQLLRNPSPLFAEVAQSIANGEPPEWLVSGLEHFSAFIGSDDTVPADAKDIFQQMHDAADVLLKYLPIFQHLPLGLPCHDEVQVVLGALPGLKEKL